MLFLLSADFFPIQFFRKNSFRTTISECQTDWIKIRPDVLLDLFWVQTVCKGYQQMTLVGKELTYGANASLLRWNFFLKISRL